MSSMQATLRALLGRLTSMPALAGEANELLYASTSPEKYVTAALVDLDPASGAIRWVGAGHLDNVILRANGDAVPLVSTGTPLGLLPPMLPYDEIAHELAPGDTLVLFSDGVTEAQDADGEEFGESRLLDVLRAAQRGAGRHAGRSRVRGDRCVRRRRTRSSTTSRCWSCGACPPPSEWPVPRVRHPGESMPRRSLTQWSLIVACSLSATRMGASRGARPVRRRLTSRPASRVAGARPGACRRPPTAAARTRRSRKASR